MPLRKDDDPRVPNYYDSPGVLDSTGTIKSFCWDAGCIEWSHNPFPWDDVSIVLELVELALSAGGASGISDGDHWYDALQKLPEPKRKRFIRLFLKYKGIEYVEERELKEIKLTAKDVRSTASAVLEKVNMTLEEVNGVQIIQG